MQSQEYHYLALKLLEKNPELSQRQIAQALGVSLGKAHYVVRALVDIGCIKLRDFHRSDNKLGYMYLLTAKGAREKANLAKRFLAQKQDEYKRLQSEIKHLKAEVKKH